MGADSSSSTGTPFQQFVLLIDWGLEHSPEQRTGCRLKRFGADASHLSADEQKPIDKIKNRERLGMQMRAHCRPTVNGTVATCILKTYALLLKI